MSETLNLWRKRLSTMVAKVKKSEEQPDPRYKAGDTVVYILNGQLYDFGEYSRVPKMCFIYEVGKKGVENSLAVKVENIRRTFKPKK